MTIRCERCRQTITRKSAFAIALKRGDDVVLHDIVRATTLIEGDVAIHVNGDHDCGRLVSSFRSDLVKKLSVPEDFDLSFLDFV